MKPRFSSIQISISNLAGEAERSDETTSTVTTTMTTICGRRNACLRGRASIPGCYLGRSWSTPKPAVAARRVVSFPGQCPVPGVPGLALRTEEERIFGVSAGGGFGVLSRPPRRRCCRWPASRGRPRCGCGVRRCPIVLSTPTSGLRPTGSV